MHVVARNPVTMSVQSASRLSRNGPAASPSADAVLVTPNSDPLSASVVAAAASAFDGG